ncbi:hypothetical protein GQX73_g10418 [Xylaria multiplex]|uniref:Gamma-glutamylcyclotransferase AIG2-like domain-containing protein n=1 Tax=Xylaria multiplex TaxID=323545 RepID=A0A7C8ISY8_9PEZI|nr:hypothetical protein GQX73_g10418 [Xylaria multiplex]
MEEANAILATLPPIESQYPTSTSDEKANAHNTSILAIRGLRTTATGFELFRLANMALCNNEIATTLHHYSSSHEPEHSNDSNSLGKPGEDKIEDSDEDFVIIKEITVITFEPFYFFFYGSLQIREVLQRICKIPDGESEDKKNGPIILHERAVIHGWKVKLWGPFPALVPAAVDDTEGVQGMAWFCEKPEHVARLCAYETDAYRMAYCDILLPSTGDVVEVLENARTFVSTLGDDELEDGEFNIAECKRNMIYSW